MIYPWYRWLDGEVHMARYGYDYFVHVDHFRRRLHDKASAEGMTVSVHNMGTYVEFQFKVRERVAA